MNLNVTQSNNDLTLQVHQSNVKATLSVTQSINKLHITAVQNSEVIKLQPIITVNSSTFVETDPIFQASEASLFVAGDKANLDNQSGINSGDETTLSIQAKRPLKTVNGESLEGSGNVQIDYNDLDNLPTLITNHSQLNLDDGTNPHGTTKSDVGLGSVDNTSDADKPISNATQNVLDSKLNKDTTAGVERAYIINADGSQGTKSTSDFKDVLEFANLASFPATGESGKIYLALDTNKTYRWSGSTYVQIGGGASGDIENYFVNSINWSRYVTRASMSGNTYLGASLISSTGIQVPSRHDAITATIARNTVFRLCIIQATSNAFSEILSPQIDKSDFQIGIFTGLFILSPGANSTFRAFAGTSNITAFGNINPSQYLSYMFGIGCDDTDTNYQLIYGEDSSSRVKIDLGWTKNIQRFIMIKFNQTTTNGNTDVYVKSVLDGLEFTTSVNYRFKGGWRVWANRGNTSTIADVNCGYSNVEINVRNDI